MMPSRFKPSFISRLAGAPGTGFTLALALLALTVVGSDADAGSLTVSRAYGVVQVMRAGSHTWITANERMRLRSGDRLKTGERSWCYLELSARNVVKVMDRTTLDLTSVGTHQERVAGRTIFAYRGVGAFDLKLVEGQIVPVLDRFAGSSMTLATPVAVAGVRGTVFSATVERVEGSVGAGAGVEGAATYNVDLTVYHGAVEVTDLRNPNAGGTMVPAGYSLGFQNVRVPAGGFQRSQAGPSAAGGQGGPGAGGNAMGAGGQQGNRQGRPGEQQGNGQGRPGEQQGNGQGRPGEQQGGPGEGSGGPGRSMGQPAGGQPAGGQPAGPGEGRGPSGGAASNGGGVAARGVSSPGGIQPAGATPTGAMRTGAAPSGPAPTGAMQPSGPLSGSVRPIGPMIPGGPNAGGVRGPAGPGPNMRSGPGGPGGPVGGFRPSGIAPTPNIAIAPIMGLVPVFRPPLPPPPPPPPPGNVTDPNQQPPATTVP